MAMKKFTESKIKFEFGPDSGDVYQTGNDSEFGFGLMNVDFIIRKRRETLLIEVKAIVTTPELYFKNDEHVEEFVAKARDTYTYLHLTKDTNKPLTYVVVIDFKNDPRIDSALIIRKHETLKAKLKQERNVRWKFDYIQNVKLFPSLDRFKKEYTTYSATRVP
jgi:hypothetical protein